METEVRNKFAFWQGKKRPEFALKQTGSNNPNYGKGDKIRGQNHYRYNPNSAYKQVKFCECGARIHYLSHRCRSCAKISSFNPNYRGGITPLGKNIRTSSFMKEWSKSIFKRDNYNCQLCNHHGGRLEADHIKPFSIILKEFLSFYNNFSPIEDKETLLRLSENYAPFWDITNGRTLCPDCHKNTDTYGMNSKYILKRL